MYDVYKDNNKSKEIYILKLNEELDNLIDILDDIPKVFVRQFNI